MSIKTDVPTSNLSILQEYIGKTIKEVTASYREADEVVSPSLHVVFTDGSFFTLSTSEWMYFE